MLTEQSPGPDAATDLQIWLSNSVDKHTYNTYKDT